MGAHGTKQTTSHVLNTQRHLVASLGTPAGPWHNPPFKERIPDAPHTLNRKMSRREVGQARGVEEGLEQWAHRGAKVGLALERALYVPRPERGPGLEWTAWAPGTERTAWAPGTERTLERTAWVPGTERTAWAPGTERTAWAPGTERTAWAPGTERALERAAWAPGTERTAWAPGTERTAWAPGTERALERTAWAPGTERTAWAPGTERALERTLSAPGTERALERTLSAPGTERALERTLSAPGTERALERTLSAPGTERALERTLSASGLERALQLTPPWRLSRLNSEPGWCSPPATLLGPSKASGIWRARQGLPRRWPWGRYSPSPTDERLPRSAWRTPQFSHLPDGYWRASPLDPSLLANSLLSPLLADPFCHERWGRGLKCRGI